MRSRFGEFVLDSSERVLLRSGAAIELEPKVFDCLELLVAQAGRLVTKERVQDALWPDVRVGPGALRRVINEARRALGDRGDAQALIRTRKGVGYVFVAAVERDDGKPAATAAAVAAPTWPFVGRARELALLLERIGSGAPPGLCFLSGEAGAGKSTLLTRLRAHELARAGLWLTGRCQAAEGVPAFWPFREVAEQLIARRSALGAALRLEPREHRALRVIPELLGEGPTVARADEVSGEERFEACAAFAKLLTRPSQVMPLYLVLEDVHWADDGSLLMLETLARVAREHPIAIFASYRPEAVAPGKALSQLIARTSGRDGVTTVQLSPLTLEDVRALLAAVRLPGSASGAAQALHELTAGNALLVHEQVAHALSTETPFDAQLPASLAHIVAQRVSLLPEATRKLLGQAAVLGHELNVAQLAALAGAPRAQVLADLEPALRADVLRPAGEDPDQLRFRHALVGDALYASLPVQLREDYHRDAFRAFQSSPEAASRSGELAVHAFLAGSSVPLETRRELCARAGSEAFEALAFDRAALHLGRAVRLLVEGDSSRQAAELALRWAQARFAADEPSAAIEQACAQALELARRAGAHDVLAEAALGHAVGFESSVQLRAASMRPYQHAIVEEALEHLLAAPQEQGRELAALRYRLAAALCWMRAEAGELSDFFAAARRAEQLAPRDPDAHIELQLAALRVAADPERDPARLADFMARIGSAAVGARQKIEMCILAMGVCLSRGDIGGYERARSEIERLTEGMPHPPRFGSLGDRMSIYVALPALARASVDIVRGDFGGAQRGLERLAERAAALGLARSREGDDSVFYLLLQLLGYQGRAATLEPLIELHVRTPGANMWRVALVQAQFAIERGDLAVARERFAVLRQTGFRPVLGGELLLTRPEMLVRAADVCPVVGDEKDATNLYEQLRPRAQHVIHDGALICYGSASRALGALALQRGDHDCAAAHLADALAMNERIGHRPELACTRLVLAQLARARGRSGEARELLAAVRAEASAIGMPRLIADAERLTP